MLRVWVSSFYNYQKPPQTFSLVTGIESMEYYYCKLVLAYGEKVKIKLNGDLTTQLYDYIMNSNNKFGYRKLTDKNNPDHKGGRFKFMVPTTSE